MIKVEAIVREEVFEDVKEALNAIDVNGITVSQVMGCGIYEVSLSAALLHLLNEFLSILCRM